MLSSLSSNVVLAKARAKYGKRLKEKDYRNLLDCKSVAEVVAYLKANTDYHDVLTGINEYDIHRGQHEAGPHGAGAFRRKQRRREAESASEKAEPAGTHERQRHVTGAEFVIHAGRVGANAE